MKTTITVAAERACVFANAARSARKPSRHKTRKAIILTALALASESPRNTRKQKRVLKSALDIWAEGGRG